MKGRWLAGLIPRALRSRAGATVARAPRLGLTRHRSERDTFPGRSGRRGRKAKVGPVRSASTGVVALVVAACTGATPTPVTVYVTAPPAEQPTPIIVYVTPAPRPVVSSAAPEAQATPSPKPKASTPWKKSFKGVGELSGEPFKLPAGNYRADWTKADRDAIANMFLKPWDPGAGLRTQTLGMSGVGQKTKGTNYLPAVGAGEYFLQVFATRGWKVTLTRIP